MIIGAAVLFAAARPTLAEPDARDLFGAASLPAPSLAGARSIGGYAKGCLAGAQALPADGPGWQVMRPSRNRAWGHPTLVLWIESFAAAARAEGWPGLLIGDMAQPRGGPMRSGHASHQLGLDVDIWFKSSARLLLPAERDSIGAVSVLRPGTREVDPALFGPAETSLLQLAAQAPQTERIFVNPAIKAQLCASAGADRAWLAKLRPWWGHDDHFHVRLACPAAEPFCREQEPPPAGDGCGTDLAWWLSDEAWKPQLPARPPTPIRLADLPVQCRQVLTLVPAAN